MIECTKCKCTYDKSNLNNHDCLLSVLMNIREESLNRSKKLEENFLNLVDNLDKRLVGFNSRITNMEMQLNNLVDFETEKYYSFIENIKDVQNKGNFNDNQDSHAQGTKPITKKSGKKLDEISNFDDKPYQNLKNKQQSTNSIPMFKFNTEESVDVTQVNEKYKPHSVLKWYGLNSAIFMNTNGSVKTISLTTCYNRENTIVKFYVDRMANKDYLCLGLINYPLDEEKVWLGLNYEKSWSLFGNGVILEEGEPNAKNKESYSFKESDLVIITVIKNKISITINEYKTKYSYTMSSLSDKYYAAVSTKSKNDCIQIVS